MEIPKLQSSERIIDKSKTLEISEDDIRSSLQRLRAPLAGIGSEKAGEAVGHFEGKVIAIAYRAVDGDSRYKIDNILTITGIDIDNEFEKADNWREVTHLTLEQEGEVLDFMQLAPKGFRLFFNPASKIENGCVSKSSNDVYVFGSIATLDGVLTVLHEVGHMWDFKRLRDAGIEKLTDDHAQSNRAEKVRKERAASAFALAVLRRISKNQETRRDAVISLKHIALKGYCDQMAEDIARDEHLMGEYAKEFDTASWDDEEREMTFSEDWLKWKRTTAYQVWKSQSGKEISSDDDIDEYLAWREWLVKTGYEYWKDLQDSEDAK